MAATLFDLAAKLSLDSKDYDKGINDAESKGKSFSSSLASGAKVAAGAIAAVGTATVAMAGYFLNATGKTAEYGDSIDKMSQKLGISIKGYQEWDFILQHSGSSIDGMKTSMKALTNAAASNNEAFKKLGISQKELSELSNEELFARTITALQNVTDESERSRLASQLLGKGAMELGALLNTSAEDTEAMRRQVHELGGVMSDEAVKAAATYQDSLQNMNTAISGLKNRIMSDFLPSVSSMMDGLAAIFSGNEEEGVGLLTKGVKDFVAHLSQVTQEIIPIAGQIISSLAEAIIENLPTLIETATQVILTLVEGFIEHLPDLLQVAIQIITTLAEGIARSLPELIPVAVEALGTLVETFYNNLPMIIDAGIKLLGGLIDGLIKAIPKLVAALPKIINAMVNYFTQALPMIVQAGVKLLQALIQNLPQIISTIVAALPQIIQAMVNFFIGAIPMIVQAGIQLLVALIQALPTIINTIVAALPQIIQAICNTLIENLPAIIDAGVQLFTALIQNLPLIIQTICSAVPSIIQGLVNAFGSFMSTIWDIGKNIVRGIWEGIKSMGEWLWNMLTGWVDSVFGWIKGLFGIASPSKLMRDQVGKMLGMGIAEGLEDSIGDVKDASNDLLGAIPDVAGQDFSMNVRRNLSDSYSQGMDIMINRISQIMEDFQQTIILQLDDRELGRAVRGYV